MPPKANIDKFVGSLKVKRDLLNMHFEKMRTNLNSDTLNRGSLIARFTKTKSDYEEFSKQIEELMLSDPDNEIVQDFYKMSDIFYEIESECDLPNHDNTINSTRENVSERSREMDLPKIEIPKFDDNLSEWLTFRNTFVTLVHDSKLTALQKFSHLKTCLKGTATDKIKIYSLSDKNYKKAWKYLNESYGEKRHLAVNYYDAILEMRKVLREDESELTKLIDDARQNMSMLESLDFVLDENMILRILEKCLPL